MKQTLLDIVQAILSSLDGDEVNSITDTVESLQIAGFVRDSYAELTSGLNLPESFTLFELVPSNDATKPTVMYIPNDIQNLIWMKYDKRLEEIDPQLYQVVTFMDLSKFAEMMYNLGNDSNVTDIGNFEFNTGHGNVTMFYRTDRAPRYYTSFNDKTLVFDSYDASVDATLQASKTVCYGEVIQGFQMIDTFIPNLDEKQFSLLLNEAKSQSFVESKGQPNPKAEQRARRGWVRSQKKKYKIDTNNYKIKSTVNFGRI